MKFRRISKAINIFRKLRLKWIDKKGGDISQIAENVMLPYQNKIIQMQNESQRSLSEPITLENVKYSKMYQNLYSSLVKTINILGCSSRNNVHVFNKGEEFFLDLWSKIDNATDRIWLESYIYVFDYIGNKTIEKLTEAAKRGVQVILIIDSFGTMFNLSKTNYIDLINAGGYVYMFNEKWSSLLLPWKRISPLIRDHRKICIVDDICYVGGMNIENIYSAYRCDSDFKNGVSSLSKEELKNTMRDTQTRIEGECMKYMETIFKESYEQCEQFMPYKKEPDGFKLFEVVRKMYHKQNAFSKSKEILKKLRFWKEEKKILDQLDFTNQYTYKDDEKYNDLFVQVIPSNPKRGVKDLQKTLYSILGAATEYIHITTPYFVPPYALAKSIIKAADRGVKVQILTSGVSEVPLFKPLAQSIYGEFLKHENIEILEYYDRILHAKTLIVDGLYSSFGSYNLDRLSYNLHMEIGVNVFDVEVSEVLENHFIEDKKNAKVIQLKEWEKRGFFLKLLGRFLLFLFRLFTPK